MDGDMEYQDDVNIKELDEELKKQKKHQVYMYPMIDNGTFVPLDQEINSNIKYTGNGFIPCEGFVPSPRGCDFQPYFARLQRPY